MSVRSTAHPLIKETPDERYPPLTVQIANSAPKQVTNTATVSGGGASDPSTATATTTVNDKPSPTPKPPHHGKPGYGDRPGHGRPNHGHRPGPRQA
ncbi:hypothetical protein V1460_28410 [Streptomyces sp. SCSIO 30461]|uniref:hypothetical protein n=1 Tax=Streptomyces sp. SCSIO 30461 TaxID=3118085 RepID=UPI0030CB57D4